MKKLLVLILPLLIVLAACRKKDNSAGCQTSRACTAEFASIGVQFIDKDGNYLKVNDITVTNLRSNSEILVKNKVEAGFSPNTYFIATDANKDEFSTAGDDVKLTTTTVGTNKLVTAMLKISGGCNCHIQKVSGTNKIVVE